MRATFFYLFCCFSFALAAQNALVSGSIKSSFGEDLDGVAIQFRGKVAYTNSQGQYLITVPANRKTKIVFSLIGYIPDSVIVNPKSGEQIIANFTFTPKENVLDEVDVVSESRTIESGTDLKARELEFIVGPMNTVEALIKTLPGVVSRSEFSSQYSVRGGSFDENLVYVNGIEVYRPFLARSGQQEGLSFVNSDMVGNIYFSAGGFPARYGDKMSSVLDITYRKPEPFGVRFQASLMGGSIRVERMKNSRSASPFTLKREKP